MKTIQMYEHGDVVKVVDEGQRYETYADMFKAYGISDILYYTPTASGFKKLKKGYLYKVVRQVTHLCDHQHQVVFIMDKAGYVYLIHVDGLELYQPQEEKWA